jgi:cytochrome c1
MLSVKRLIFLSFLALACGKENSAPSLPAESVDTAIEIAVRHRCTMCHVIPGVPGNGGALGPSLAGVGNRETISNGTVPNDVGNLSAFIRKPTSLNPSSLMPSSGMTEAESDLLARYLMTLR